MKVVCFVSGLLRTFTDTLFPFLCELANHVDLHLYLMISHETQDTKFYGTGQLDIIQSHPICKQLTVHQPTFANHLPISQREKNTIYQWYNLYECFLHTEPTILSNADIVIRIRPDIAIDCTVETFLSILTQAQSFQGVTIPTGSDIFSKEYLSITNACINDQFAFGPPTYMAQYCLLFPTLTFTDLESPIISESLLFNYCVERRLPVKRVPVSYHLCLSECKMVAITGDSGVGKSTFVEAIRDCFPFDSQLVLETDRYHKWERGHEQWKTMTHLHPDANFLERMNDDTYQLKMGQQIQQVDYDHSSGQFTSPSTIDSKPFMFLCGLHTLYKRELRAWCDLKVYIDTDLPLKRLWKIQRDMKKRGYTFAKCMEIFTVRQADYEQYILPQKAHADIVIRYFTQTPLPEVFGTEEISYQLECICEVSNPYVPCVDSFLQSVSTHVQTNQHSNRVQYSLQDGCSSERLLQLCAPEYRFILQSEKIRPSFQGIIQLLMIQLMIDALKLNRSV